MEKNDTRANYNYGFPTPGPQQPTGQDVMNHVFFTTKSDWKKIQETEQFDFIVLGSSFCCLAFVERTLSKNPFAKILILERGEYFLPEHFQNLPLPYKQTLGGLSETYPWTLSKKTTEGEYIKWQHGMLPFFGGRSTLWSAWCPRPTKEEMINWPKEVIANAHNYFATAEKLLNVVPTDQIDSPIKSKPVYGVLQKEIQQKLNENYTKIKEITRTFAAPLAVKTPDIVDLDFSKFSVPGKLLEIAERQKELFKKGKGALVHLVTNCLVSKIIAQDNYPTALDTSRGIINIGEAKLILAMGTMPPTTLIQNSFPELKNVGKRFTSHFISAIIARIPRAHFKFAKDLAELELGAFYIAGVNPERGHEGQFHIQLTALSDKNPNKNIKTALINMPDVVATATKEQLLDSKDYVVFVCATLGELDYNNEENWFLKNADLDPTTNTTLQVIANRNDMKVWDSMDTTTFETLEEIISPEGKKMVEYWDTTTKKWENRRPTDKSYRVSALVHEASTLWISDKKDEGVVDVNYKVKKVENVYVTGAALWPTGASWNPTLTMVALAQHLADNLSK
ncbi:GMC family oxidoreductase [Cellulophaga sp. E16_2]|uniref:GMC oxidoreductase n=1 Tax=Cellulophaga sp. E16_2 TaxID=2789297 RepID=UPI001A937F09|nr:GMC oxidoreductase [Cellulophaga sp. E16_2]MBO0590520.1 GMC family oxidoreductase [Cellulophaga sp. E16_2]